MPTRRVASCCPGHWNPETKQREHADDCELARAVQLLRLASSAPAAATGRIYELQGWCIPCEGMKPGHMDDDRWWTCHDCGARDVHLLPNIETLDYLMKHRRKR